MPYKVYRRISDGACIGFGDPQMYECGAYNPALHTITYEDNVPTMPLPTDSEKTTMATNRIDNEKALKALGLVLASYMSKTPAQVRADFITAYKSLL